MNEWTLSIPIITFFPYSSGHRVIPSRTRHELYDLRLHVLLLTKGLTEKALGLGD